MPALRIAPPLPPEPATRGQRCFVFLNLVIIVQRTRRRSTIPVECKAPRPTPTRNPLEQATLLFFARPQLGNGVDGDCERFVKCPWVSCRHHLYLEVDEEDGEIKFNFPDLEPDEMEETCSLRFAANLSPELVPVSHLKVGLVMGLSDASVWNAEQDAFRKVQRKEKRRQSLDD